MMNGSNSVVPEQLAHAILECGRARDPHFDPEISSDGPFTLLLTLFKHREDWKGMSITALIAAVDNRVSTSIYLLDRLVDWDHVERVGEERDERFRLTAATERNVELYLMDCAQTVRRAISPEPEPQSRAG